MGARDFRHERNLWQPSSPEQKKTLNAQHSSRDQQLTMLLKAIKKNKKPTTIPKWSWGGSRVLIASTSSALLSFFYEQVNPNWWGKVKKTLGILYPSSALHWPQAKASTAVVPTIGNPANTAILQPTTTEEPIQKHTTVSLSESEALKGGRDVGEGS